jgi:hypothetical protein
MRKILALAALTGAVTTSACESLGQAMTAHTDVVARAAGHELTVAEASALLAINPQLPPQTEVVDALANLWVDYILLATAATQDTTLSNVNLDPLVRPHMEQEIVWKLRDAVIQPDTVFTDEQLRALFEAEQPGLEVRARHVLLSLPPDATPAQRDSVIALARDVQQRAAGGEDFGALAELYSHDPGSARQGGDLGFFGRGQMVAPFEEAAMGLREGQVSDVIETPFGFHVIKVEERRLPDFELAREQFREQAKAQAQLQAEEAYIAQVTDPLGISVQDDAPEVARELARKPGTRLSGRAANRPLVSYKGGAFTAGEYLEMVRRFPPSQRSRLAAAGDEDLQTMLRGLTQNEILVNEARRRGLEVTPAERDSLDGEARRQLDAAAAAAGLKGITPQEGETQAQAIERKVQSLMESIVRGERNVLPLGPLAYSLRERWDAEIFERNYERVVAQVQEQRPPMPMPMPGQMPPQP